MMISLIENINFNSLKFLMITKSRIDNIEQLSFLNMNNLSKIRLFRNKITCLKPFNKTNWSCLSILCLEDNFISSIELNRMRTTKSMNVFLSNYAEKTIQIQNVFELMKIQPIKIESINLPKG